MGVYEEGSRVWPQLGLSEPELEKFLAGREPSEPPPSADLFLACACVLGRPEALAALDKNVLAQVPGWVSRIDGSREFGDDVVKSVRSLMLDGSAPRLASYAGKSPLDGFVRVAAVRVALKQKPKTPSEPLPEVELKPAAAQALAAVVTALDPEERGWLELCYLDGLSIERIASLFGVPASTTSRRVAGLEEHVLVALRERLQHQLRLPLAEVDSLVKLVRANLPACLSKALAA